MSYAPQKGNAPEVAATEASSESTQDTNLQENSVSNSTLIPVFSGTLAGSEVQLCDARTLHGFMQVGRDFTSWIKGRIRKFGFAADEDYLLTKSGEQVPHQGGTRTIERTDYHLTLDMAKELAMVENNDQGRVARRYFIACERRLIEQERPYNPAIDYDRISPAQAQDLKEIVEAIVKAGVQGFAETWARLHRKFKVNSYLELPATRHLEARQYLIDKLPKGSAETVVEEQPAAPTMFGRQWLVSTDMAGRETVRPVAPDQFVKSYREIARGIAVGDLVPSTAELVDLASACNQRLVHRLGNPALVLAV